MAKICPETNDYVLYLDCLECEDKVCETLHESIGNNDERYYLLEKGSEGGNVYKRYTLNELKEHFYSNDMSEEEAQAWENIKNIDDVKDFIEKFVNNFCGMHYHDYYIEEDE